MIETSPILHTLKNGVRLLAFPLAGTETVSALILVKVGSRNEQKHLQGISHFLEHIFFKGTKKRPSPVTIAKEIDGIGGNFNAFTGKEYTGFFITGASDKLSLILDILSDILTHSLFDAKEIERERGVILEEMRMYFDTPSDYIQEVFERLLYGQTPLGRDIVGTLDTVSQITRKDFVDYVRAHYRGGNIVITLAGKITPEVIKKAQSFFKNFSTGKQEQFEKVRDLQKAPAVFIKEKATDQAHMGLGVRAFAMNDKRRETLDLLATLLGGQKSSRMFLEVREKLGLAYYIYTEPVYYADAGYISTFAGVNVENIDLAIKTILKEYDKLTQKKVGCEELQTAKDYVKGRLLIELESSFRMARLVGTKELLFGQHEPLKAYFERLDAITAQDIQNLAKDIFKKDHRNLAIIGPFKEDQKKRFEKLLSH